MITFPHRSRNFLQSLLAATLLSTVIGMLAAAPSQAGSITLRETGSTLLYPLFTQWIPDYAKLAPDVTLTAAATGSGAGEDAALAGKVSIGASDAYLSDRVAAKNPNILDIPLAISAQTINYNLPGLNSANIKIDGPTLAAIYSGTVTQWDDPAIKAMNPGVTLPHQTIIPVRRAEGSGDTFIFTQFLDFSTETGVNEPGYDATISGTNVGTVMAWPKVGTAISWPDVAAEKTATGNDGVVKTLAATPYSIGYVGISYADQITKAGLGTAMVKNQDGKFVLPTPRSIAHAAARLDPRTPSYERITLIFAPGEDSYPLINYEYAVVSKRQPDAATADALRTFLLWSISEIGGNSAKYLKPVGFIPLPDFIRGLSEKQIGEIAEVKSE
ncbi:MAG TPA: phosphate ABC transporter substrate-binding protein PstS [Bradyrhizobium sp.]|nr:phosphate ABC transporter substrate-binding protein PstS [Bradyrhizobium sp.]